MDIKVEKVELDGIDIDYHENNTNIQYIINENELLKKFFDDYETVYNNHINILKNNNIKDTLKYNYSVIGFLINSVQINKQILFIKSILKEYYDKNTKFDKKIIDKVISYLDYEMILINYYSDIKYDKSKLKIKIFVGFIINKQYYVIEQINNNKDKDISSIKINKSNFVEANKEVIHKIKEHKSICKTKECEIKSKYNFIYAIVEYNRKKDTTYFKIVDKSSEEEVFTKNKKISKRSLIKGRMCETFQTSKLIELREKLGMYKISTKKKNSFICEDIQIFFRYMNYINKKYIWIENVEF
jgi:hypothetical protein